MRNRSGGSLGGLITVAGLLLCAGQALAQPANDLCANAQLVTVGANSSVTVSGTNVAATTDGSSAVACATSARDVWYRVVAPANGVLTASLCGGVSFDSVLAIRSACPGSGATLACDDDGCTGSAGLSITSTGVTAGTTYWIRVAGFGSTGATGSFNLTVTHGPPPAAPNPNIGPDVIVNQVTDVARWGADAAAGVTAYSVGTDSCNPGDYPVLWIDNTTYSPDYGVTQHPVIGQNMYRLKSYGAYSRFEQLGQSWLKHGFLSTNSGACGGCTPGGTNLWRFSSQAYQNVGSDVLGVTCSDTYGSNLNGSQGGLGAKNIVNPTLGTSPFVTGNGTGNATTRERLQVPTADVASQPVGTRFYVDAQYMTADDAQFVRPGQNVAVNGLNNSSWRELTASTINATPAFAGTTVQQQPGIFAWRVADPAVTLVAADHDDTPNPCTGWRDPFTNGPQYPAGTKFIRGRFWVAAKVTDLGGGQWRYEYAVHNLNSDRGSNSFSVPYPAAAGAPSGFTFHAPQWHSGEPYSNAPWTMSQNGNRLVFSTSQAYNAANDTANAQRWGQLFNFGFTSSVAPSTGNATVGLFKTGTLASVDAVGVPVPTLPPSCPADFNQDGNVDPDDLGDFITCFFSEPPCPGADFNGDSNVDPDDIGDYITTFFGPPC